MGPVLQKRVQGDVVLRVAYCGEHVLQICDVLHGLRMRRTPQQQATDRQDAALVELPLVDVKYRDAKPSGSSAYARRARRRLRAC